MTAKQNLSSLLFYPFETGALEVIPKESNILFWNMVPCHSMQNFENIDVLQSFKPDADLWKNYKVNLLHNVDGCKKYDYVFCVLPQQKEATFFMLAQALNALVDGGLLVTVAANDAGGKQIESKLKQFGVSPHSLSKNKSRIVWAIQESIDPNIIEQHLQKGVSQKIKIEDYEFTTQAGVYGWNKIDKGSKLLIDNLPENLSGIGADFGCGYGFLTTQILSKPNKLRKIYALEADYNALQCARENLKNYNQVEYNWIDLTTEVPIKNLDWIVMNPPFHEGKKADHQIGQKFIEKAYDSLKKKGYLYMVANTHLPYEKTLGHFFTSVEKIDEQQGYKILFAQK